MQSLLFLTPKPHPSVLMSYFHSQVLVALFLTIASASAGIISYPIQTLGYGYTYPSLVSHPTYTYFSRSFLPLYPGHYDYPLVFGPPPFLHNFFPDNVFLNGVPGIIHPRTAPGDKPEMDNGKKPDGKKDEKDSKDEAEDVTTEKPKKEDDSKSEVEDLRE
ncbi:hypothetical protein RUM43_004156 [Polyplax serrata]|uniref:Uncharacterized protein n=1 Tax=Polyplax serrata TaxID=468196 RepID=A0AAN8XL16_POLSC